MHLNHVILALLKQSHAKTNAHIRCTKSQQIEKKTQTGAHTRGRCCGLTLISAALARTRSSISMTSVSPGDDQHIKQECLSKFEKEHSFFQSAFLLSSPCSCDFSIFSCCTAGSSIAALPGCRFTAEEAELPLHVCVCVDVYIWHCGSVY